MGRWLVLGLVAAALAACGKTEGSGNAADQQALAAGFTPPQVTTRVDWGGRMERRFRELDRNGDDKLAREEWPRADSRLATYDRDRDDEVSLEEYNEGAIARFDRMDLNRDGTVTSEEQETTQNGTAPAPAAAPVSTR
jgi:hypothetical protein